MKINDKELDINELTKNVYNDRQMMKMRGNGIYLSDNDVEVLNRYDINYQKYGSLSSLIFEIEQILNEETDLSDLEEISKKLSEINYYNNTNKWWWLYGKNNFKKHIKWKRKFRDSW